MRSQTTAFALAGLHLGAVLGAGPVRPVIRADTNRDGILTEADDADKALWTPARGAIFLPNVGDAHGRCANTDLRGNPLSNHELAACHDASGHLLLEPSLVAPLATLPVDVADDAFAYVYATPDAAADRVRLFVNDYPDRAGETAAWRFVDPEFRFNATQLRAGIALGIDGREFVTDASAWDGVVRVRFDLYANDTVLSDTVELRVAPVLTHHHLQRVDELVTVAANESDPVQLAFVEGLDRARRDAGLAAPLYLFNQSSDIWAQDFFEPAYASMPGPDGGVVAVRIMLRSAQSTRTGGRQVFEQLRGKGVGGFQPADGRRRGFGHREINSFGNVETIPPYTSKSGIKYPAGRIIQGKHFGESPAETMTAFLEGQQVQTPLMLEAGWLFIGHVDEFVQFLPSNETGLGFTIAIADTVSALEVFRNVSEAGKGGVRAISFDGNILANETFRAVNAYAQKHIDANLETLLAEIPLAREHVVRVPVLFKDANFPSGLFARSPDGLPPHTNTVMRDERLLLAFSPAAINAIVIGGHYLSPKPWGPVVDGVDLLEGAVKAAYGAAGMAVSFVDDFLSHHVGGGEIHCGSNTLRETDVKWWE
ncbi:Protein-arginine deiminase type-1 [Colletotrichum higginsianum]|uniref:Protein-arginine deiminase type-1 n=1 Tax=Colletotrichum higginsianum TaxID=80884 RepID=A0A4T0WFH1_9PEZI|nr:Protein-arginine deiminase type-1 [Colletotrichum higginsianum]